MSKSNLLDEVQTKVFVYIWLNGSIVCTKPALAKKLNLSCSLVNEALKKLHEKRWIRKNRYGKGLCLESVKRDIPNYILQRANYYLNVLTG